MSTEETELADRFRDQFQRFERLFKETITSYTELGFPEMGPGESVVAAAGEVMDAYYDSHDIKDLQPYILFVNSEYGESTPLNGLLQSAFIDRFPDPKVDTELAALLSTDVRAVLDKRWDWRSDADSRAFINRILSAFPRLGPIADENTYGREKDILPHPFIVQLSTEQVENTIANTPDKLSETRQILAFLETEYGKNENVDFLISDSFLGMFPYTYEPGYNIVELLGPKLEAAYRKQWNIDDNQPLTDT